MAHAHPIRFCWVHREPRICFGLDHENPFHAGGGHLESPVCMLCELPSLIRCETDSLNFCFSCFWGDDVCESQSHDVETTPLSSHMLCEPIPGGDYFGTRVDDAGGDGHGSGDGNRGIKRTHDGYLKPHGQASASSSFLLQGIKISGYKSQESQTQVTGGDAQNLLSLLSSSARDFLVRNDGEQVKVESLKGKKIGLFFSAASCGPCQRFTPQLVQVYNELSSSKAAFEVVFVSGDEDEESFQDYFSKMPWLAVPFSDSQTRDRLDEVFKVRGIPNLVMIDDEGKVVNENGVGAIRSHVAVAYAEKMKEVKEEEDRARREQTLTSVLVTPSRDFVVSRDGTKVPVSELEGKTIGLLFSVASYKKCTEFTSKLAEVYKMLKENQEDFEIVLISLEHDEEAFKQDFETNPWLALPFNDKSSSKLTPHFMLSTLPTLVILGPDGKTLHSNVVEAIDDYGVLAYPFTPEKFEELKAIEKAKLEAQTLESLLVSGDLNYVLGKDGAKVLVSDLVGKNILLYFSAHWCPPCRAFTPKLVEVYEEIKEKDEAFELIFISSDRDQESFDEYYSQMPWLALPFGDPRKTSLARTFKVGGMPMLAALGPTGKTITKEARDLVGAHGADAYPFTEERLKEIEEHELELKEGGGESTDG